MIGAALLIASLAATVELSHINVSDPAAQAFFAVPGPALTSRLVVLDGMQLRIIDRPNEGDGISVAVPDDALVIDVYTVEDDDVLHGVALCKNYVAHIRLTNSNAQWARLFDEQTGLAEAAAHPRIVRLVYNVGGQQAIAIPAATGIGLYGLDGTPLPLPQNVVAPFVSFSRRLVSPPQVGGPESLEYVISARENAGGLLDQLTGIPRMTERPGTARQIREASSFPGESWPWFSVTPPAPGKSTHLRACYALAKPAFEDTMIRVWRGPSGSPGPARRYRGAIVPPEGPPYDANGDGYSDLITWTSPRPGASVFALQRALRKKDWEVDLNVYTFDPVSKLFNAAPSGRIEASIPLGWFLTHNAVHPLRNLLSADLDGDATGDIALSQDPHTLDIWTYDDGFMAAPTWTIDFPSPRTRLEDLAPSNANTGATLLLATDGGFAVATIPKHRAEDAPSTEPLPR